MPASPTPTTAAPPAPGAVLEVAPDVQPGRSGRGWRRLAAATLLLAVIAGASAWWLTRPPGLPAGFAASNGRLEAEEIDVDTKFAGRISEILVDEGDLVKQGQVLARIDTRDIAAQLAQANWQAAQAQQAILENQETLVQMQSSLKLSAQELQMARRLVQQGFETIEVLDQRQSQFDSAMANYHTTEVGIISARAGMQAAIHNAELYAVNIADDTLVAPKDGPIEYRLHNVGEVLPAGGKVYTMLDATYVYMDIFLPTSAAGRVRFGDQASLVLDALPGRPLPATVSFIATENEFTPKAVETQSERDLLMFRIRLRIDPALLRAHEAHVRSGLPGMGYIRLDRKAGWPDAIKPLPRPPAHQPPTNQP
ncbi:HlyD family secretion protein [Lichenicoccus roseus]|uniref:HlyD family secretion protein n=1 Tax=Lichenicoccus roseus TaxID=2683649 RepID=UPI00197F85D6|nr:HlyD family efflux transporter periplasmic adaptor subunit [Lichenicoccus roseus]